MEAELSPKRFQIKNRTMGNVQEVNNCINILVNVDTNEEDMSSGTRHVRSLHRARSLKPVAKQLAK
jgi:hypothetical protein